MVQYCPSRVRQFFRMDTISVARWAQSLLPAQFELPARLWYLKARGFLHRGDSVHCPCCGKRYSEFLGVSSPVRPAACPGCDSRERQRLMFLYLRERTRLFSERLRVLHFAPEDCLQSVLSRLSNLDYLSADISSRAAMVRVDITKIQFPDDTFDVILCSHVLEHIDDDRRAMLELRRVLRPGGWAILQVPVDVSRKTTFEDARITDPAERTRLFGQWDHVRIYGLDYPQRLREAGFAVQVIPYPAELGSQTVSEFGLDPDELIYHCGKPA